MKKLILLFLLSFSLFGNDNIKETVSLLSQTIEQKLPIQKNLYTIKNITRLNNQIFLIVELKSKEIEKKLGVNKIKTKEWKIKRKYITQNLNNEFKNNLCFDQKLYSALENGLVIKYQIYLDTGLKLTTININYESCTEHINFNK